MLINLKLLVDLKKLSDVVHKEAVKDIVYNKLNSNINNLENKIPNASTLIQINQCNSDKQILEKKLGCS